MPGPSVTWYQCISADDQCSYAAQLIVGPRVAQQPSPGLTLERLRDNTAVITHHGQMVLASVLGTTSLGNKARDISRCN